MSSNFTASDLRNGLTLPIKLQHILQRPPTAHSAAFNKLAELITSNFHARKAHNHNHRDRDNRDNKENREHPNREQGNRESRELPRPPKEKNIRINSIKQPSLARPNSIPHQQQCFTEFFEYFASNRDSEAAEGKFKPYREQETYLAAPAPRHHHSALKTRKKAATLNKKYELPDSRSNNTRSLFGQWEIEQENSNFSILFKNHQNA